MFRDVFSDKVFMKKVLAISIPVVLQQLLLTTFNIVDTIMVGSIYRGVASVGLAAQIGMIVIMIIFGINAGIALYIAQYFGANQTEKIKKAFALMITSVFVVSTLFAFIGFFFGKEVLSLFTSDPEVLIPSAAYLKIAALSYVPNMLSFAFAMTYRNIQKSKVPLIISLVTMAANVTLNALLIFGLWGFPELGIVGAAYGTFISTLLGLFIHVIFIIKTKQLFLPNISHFISALKPDFAKPILKRTFPLMLNEVFFGIGMSLYIVIYNQLGTDAYEGYRMAETISNLLFVVAIGLASAVSAIIGQELGRNDFAQAKAYSRYFFKLGFLLAIFIGLFTAALAHPLIAIFRNDQAEVVKNAVLVLYVFGFRVALRIFTVTLNAIFRAGGKSRFIMFLDGGIVWLIGLPIAFISHHLLGIQHIAILFLLVNLENIARIWIGIHYYLKDTWQENLALQHDGVASKLWYNKRKKKV